MMARGSSWLVSMLLLLAALEPAIGQRLAGGLSNREISIDSSFSGETLTIFGNVEPSTGAERRFVIGPFDVVLVVSGPALDRVARRKTSNFGIWLNTEHVTFSGFPSFKWIFSSRPLTDISETELLDANHISLDAFPLQVTTSGNGDVARFSDELVRLMRDKGLFGQDAHGVQFQSDTLYSARVTLPADVPNGRFLAETYLFQNGELLARKAEGFQVRKTGFERFIGDSARSWPLLYGLTCVLLAVFTGWLGGVVFRR